MCEFSSARAAELCPFLIFVKQINERDLHKERLDRIEGRDGKLARLNRQTSRGTASCYLDVDATGKSVVVANYSSGSVASLPVLEDGSLGEIASFVQHRGSSVSPNRQKEPHAHCIVISPDNRFALAADLGIDKILNYQNIFAESIISPNHRHKCDSSCYDCLQQYRNMNYHGLLDWRLGFSLLRALASSDFQCGIDGDFSTPDLEKWLDTATKLRDTFCGSFSSCSPRKFGSLPGFEVGDNFVIIVHPLWNLKNPIGLLAEGIATLDTDTQIRYLDTFNLLRRPSWCYQEGLKE